jgi:uncharacterized repeat protein (TIGR03803 family)
VNLNRIPIRPWLLVVILALVPAASAKWNEKVLYSFQGGTDGSTPAGGVVFDAAGNLYGTTQQGGGTSCAPISFCGTVFQLAPPAKKGGAWTETVLHTFAGVTGNQDGATPAGGLVIDAAGNLYGTTAYGGSGDCVLVGIKGGCGTVFELEPPKTKGGAWTYKILYSFQGGKDGYFPWGDLVFDKAGNLYGATQFGGGFGSCDSPYYQFCGTVFELGPPKTKGGAWKEKVLYSFKSGTDGANPNGGLVFDLNGAIYGTTRIGGFNCPHNSGQGCGTVFKLAAPTEKGGPWTERLLDRFNPGNSGPAEPVAGVVFDQSGNLYGTTFGGGNSGSGTIFQLGPLSDDKWVGRVLYRFRDGADGSGPRGSLIFDAQGDLYGTASGGGTAGNGTLFRLRPAGKSWAFTAPYDFAVSPDGAYPTGGLIFDRAGNLYGTTQNGGSGQACGSYGCGTVFEATP